MSRARTQYNKSWSFLTNDSDEKEVVEAKIKSIEKKEGRKLSVSEALRLIIISSNGHQPENVSLPAKDKIPEEIPEEIPEGACDLSSVVIPEEIQDSKQVGDIKEISEATKSLWDQMNIDGI